jgi:hypothetical protein
LRRLLNEDIQKGDTLETPRKAKILKTPKSIKKLPENPVIHVEDPYSMISSDPDKEMIKSPLLTLEHDESSIFVDPNPSPTYNQEVYQKYGVIVTKLDSDPPHADYKKLIQRSR